MRNLRTPALIAALAAAAFGVAQSATAKPQPTRTYVVVYAKGQSDAQAHKAIRAAGGTLLKENGRIGVATVRSSDPSFERDATAQRALLGAAANRPIGHAPHDARSHQFDIEHAGRLAPGGRPARPGPAPAGEPLSDAQWDMRMIGATPQGSYRRQPGSKGVRVGILDTGVDATHPDIAPNFDFALSRNFTTDDPSIDGACADDPDGSCSDPATVDENEHGTHVAGTIAAAINGIGTAGVAPNVDIVNLRAGQDSGYFFLPATLNALTYAGDNGIDVVNMSYYIDPWLYNCTANPADTPAQQREQQTVIAATQRAITYARDHGVTVVAAEGNGHTDLGSPKVDDSSPDYPVVPNNPDNIPSEAHHRVIDDSCLSMPTEADGVIGVTSVGPSKRKAYYSDYGLEQADVSAPGGDAFDRGTGLTRPVNEVLAPYPAALAKAALAANPQNPAIVEQGGAYYQWLQGTSMASPHAAGVAALIVSQYGRRDRRHGGLTLDPATTERILRQTATDTACPEPRLQRYDLNGNGTIDDTDPNPARHETQYDATCQGSPDRNGFYGDGIVNALAAVSQGHGHGEHGNGDEQHGGHDGHHHGRR